MLPYLHHNAKHNFSLRLGATHSHKLILIFTTHLVHNSGILVSNLTCTSCLYSWCHVTPNMQTQFIKTCKKLSAKTLSHIWRKYISNFFNIKVDIIKVISNVQKVIKFYYSDVNTIASRCLFILVAQPLVLANTNSPHEDTGHVHLCYHTTKHEREIVSHHILQKRFHLM